MVGIVTSAGLGLDRSSLHTLGSNGELGDASFGRYGEQVYVNADTGNLMIDRTDEILIGLGPDDVIDRSYNSLSANEGYLAHNGWQISDSRCVTGLTGTVNTDGSTVTMIDADGSDLLYTYDTTQQAYICTQNENAYHRLTFSARHNLWTWSDGRDGVTETYDALNGGRLTSSTDQNGNYLTYGYDPATGHLTTVTTMNGETTTFNWDGATNNLLSVLTTLSDGSTYTLVSYTYDTRNRLSTVTTDLTPYNHSDSSTVVTTYGYSGTSSRIASISQTGGAKLTFAYDASNRVQTVTETVQGTVTRATTFTYTDSSHTTVTDNTGQDTVIQYDGTGAMDGITLPGAQSGTPNEIISFTKYNADGDLLTMLDADSEPYSYTYDSNDNVLSETDPRGNTITRTYDEDNHVLTDTQAPGTKSGHDVGASTTTRYAYDNNGNLRYVVTADGGVTKYSYDNNGSLAMTVVVRDDTFDLSGLASNQSVDGSDVYNWMNGLDKSTTETTAYTPDARGAIATKTTYSLCYTYGGGITSNPSGEPYTVDTYVYDSMGNMTSHQTSGVGNTATYTYDGLGRLTSSIDLSGGYSIYAWNDAANSATVTVYDTTLKHTTISTETSTYDEAGELTGTSDTGLNVTNAPGMTYKYDKLGRLCMSTDATGRTTYWLYDNLGRKVADIAGDGSMTEYKYDANGNLIASVSYYNKLSSGQLHSLVDSNGNPTDPDIVLNALRPPTDTTDDSWTWNIYDEDNRLIETINSEGDLTSQAYDNNSNVIWKKSYSGVLDKATIIAGFETNPPALHTYATHPGDKWDDDLTFYYYDSENRLVATIDGDGYFTQIVYNQAGEKVETISFATAVDASLRHSTSTLDQLVANVGVTAQDIHTHYVYDDRGLLRYTLDANLRPTEYIYDGSSRLVETIDYAQTIAAPADYTASQVAAQITSANLNDPDTRTSWSVYDSATGNLAYSVDANGGVTKYGHDPLHTGEVIKQTQFATLYTSTDHTQAGVDSWAATSAVANDTDNRITRMFHDGLGQLLYNVDAEQYVTQFQYDADGRATAEIRYDAKYSVTDSDTTASVAAKLPAPTAANSVTTGYGYDADGRLTDTTNDLGGLGVITHLTYDGIGRLTSKTVAWGTPDAAVTNYTYDSANRLSSETVVIDSTHNAVTQYSYDGMGHIATTTDPNTGTTQYTYDSAGNLLKVIDAADLATYYTYDPFGNRITQKDPDGGITYFFYNTLNQLQAQIDPLGNWTGYTYTIGGAIASTTQGASPYTGTITPGILPTLPTDSLHDALTSLTRDKLDRVTAVEDAEQFTEQYTLDAFGDRTTIVNKLDGSTTDAYDHRGLLTSEAQTITWTDALNGPQTKAVTNTYQYDARGNRTQMVEASGAPEARTTTYTYDNLDRLRVVQGAAVSYVDSSLATHTGFTPQTQYSYDLRGNLIEADDPSSARTLYYYDDANRKIAEVNAVGTLSTWGYDNNGNVLTATVYGDYLNVATLTAGGSPPGPVNQNNSRATTYTYDADNRLKTTTVASQFTGALNGTSFTTTTGNLTASNTYNMLASSGTMVHQTDANGGSTWTYYDLAGRKVAEVDADNYLTLYTLDAFGNVKTETRYANQVSITLANATTLTAVTSAVTADAVNDRVTNFTYDRNGRRTAEIRKNVAYATVSGDTVTTHTGDAEIDYTYNGLGEVTQKKEATGDYTNYTYDSAGRQVEIQLAPYTDSSGTTVQTTTVNAYDGLNNLVSTNVFDANHPTTKHTTSYTYDAGGRLLTMKDANSFIRTYSYDQAGRTALVSYDRLHSDLTTKTTEGQVTQYDAAGRGVLQSIATKTGSTWSLGDTSGTVYDAYNDVIARQINGITQQTYAYDSGGRMWMSTDEGVATLYVYDKAGNESLTIESSGAALTSGSLAGFSKIDDAIAFLTTGGHAIGTVDVQGTAITATAYDPRGQAIKTIEFRRQLSGSPGSYTYANITTQRSYNAFGEVAEDIDARTNATDYTYNTEGKIVEQQLPGVSYTDEHGTTTSNARPTQYNYYDLSGRLVAVKDANSNLNTRTLLANTGYDGSDALVVKEYHADTGIVTNDYDAWGDLVKNTNEVGKVETYTYDAMGNLTVETHQQRSDLTQLIDYYWYDGLRQRLRHTNSVYSSTYKEYTDYDAQGRVTSMVDMGGNKTTYSYVWSPTATTTGLGTFGGWTKTTVNPASKTETETDDAEGRTTAKTDFGTWHYTYTYDLAGRLAYETSDYGKGNGQYDTVDYITNAYYNTGLLASQDSKYQYTITVTPPPGEGSPFPWYDSDDLTETYQYDANGNKTFEGTVHTFYDGKTYLLDGGKTTITSLENAVATYDALNRKTELTDTGYNASDPIDITWKYDLNSNIRERKATYYGLSDTGAVSGTQSTQDDWYKYDAMNRFITVKGTLNTTTHNIDIGSGQTIAYDAAGERKTVTNGSDGSVETYLYTEDGYLKEVDVGGVKRGSYTVDAMGRVTNYSEYDTNGTSVVYSEISDYDQKSQLTDQTITSVRNNGSTNDTWVWHTYYDYNEGGTWSSSTHTFSNTGGYDGGAIAEEETLVTKNGTTQPETNTINVYRWADGGAVQSATQYKPDVTQGTTYITNYIYDQRQTLVRADIGDGTPRSNDYATDLAGRILANDTSNYGGADNITGPHSRYYWFDGVQVGDVSNNGTSDVDYVVSITDNTAKPLGTGFFTNGASHGTAYADFDAAYDPVNGLSTQLTAQRYTVQAGDTLESIAQQIWGDANFWYLIADANGIASDDQLIAGQDIIIPDKVANNQNNANTYRVYDPNLAMGNTSPTHPPKPHGNQGCGVMGEVMMAVVAIAVAALIPGVGGFIAGGVTSLLGGGTAAAVVGAAVGAASVAAIGDAAGQAFGLATGITSKFSWSELGMAAVSAGVSSGLGASGVFSDLGIGGDSIPEEFAKGALTNAATQGVEVATGLQSKFDWPGVAAAGVGNAAGSFVGGKLAGTDYGFGTTLNTATTRLAAGMAGLIANAATRSLINGTDFGDNILTALPDTLAQTVGGAIADGINSAYAQAQGGVSEASADTSGVSSAEIYNVKNAGRHYDGGVGSSTDGEIDSTGTYSPDAGSVEPAASQPDVVVTAQRWDWFQDLMYDIGGEGAEQAATDVEDFFSSTAAYSTNALIAQGSAYAAGGQEARTWLAAKSKLKTIDAIELSGGDPYQMAQVIKTFPETAQPRQMSNGEVLLKGFSTATSILGPLGAEAAVPEEFAAAEAEGQASSVWKLSPIERGNAIETDVANTDYADWYHVGAERNGFFPLVDFQKNGTLVSLRTVDTTGSSWFGRTWDHLIDLGSNGAEVDGTSANMVLDLRVQPSGLTGAQPLIEIGRNNNVTVIIKEYP
jgi:YD repeat-containing protein